MPDKDDSSPTVKDEQQKSAKEEGLCIDCERSPSNPYLDKPKCVTCYSHTVTDGCSTEGCVHPPAGVFQGHGYCKVHLCTQIHYAYQGYMQAKSELLETKAELERLKKKTGFDPTSRTQTRRGLTPEHSRVDELHNRYIALQNEVGDIRCDIEDAMRHLEQPFPDNFTVFG